MTEFTVSLDVYSRRHSLTEIADALKLSPPAGSLEAQYDSEKSLRSPAVFRIEAISSSGRSLSELVEKLATRINTIRDELQEAKLKGIEMCINIGVFYETALVTIRIDQKTLGLLASLQMPVDVTCYSS